MEHKTIIQGDYVLTPCQNAFNKKISYWISKKDCTQAAYAFTPRNDKDLSEQVTNISAYIALFRNKFEERELILEKLNWLLSFIDFKASYNMYMKITLTDNQGAAFGNIEQEEFPDVNAVIERLSPYWADTFLNGSVCCDEPVTFDSYEEAYECCIKKNYVAEASALKILINGIYNVTCGPDGKVIIE